MAGLFLRGLGTGCVATASIAALVWKKHNVHSEIPIDAADSRDSSAVPSRLAAISSLGTPTAIGVNRVFNNHMLHYSHDKRVPLWVQQHLSRESLEGTSNRSSARFHSDEGVDALWRGTNADYHKSGWSRGHMAAAADNKRDMSSMSDSFILSNIVPQQYENNSDYWNRLEIYCRSKVKTFTHVWVTSGPAFVPQQTDGHKTVAYEVIGESEIAVPTHLYKVIVVEDGDGKRALAAFLIPNTALRENPPLKRFQVTLEALEKRVGFRFYDQLDRSSVGDLCAVDGCELMTKTALAQYIAVKQIKRVRDRKALEKLLGKMKKNEIPMTPDMNAALERKLQELTDAEVATTQQEPTIADAGTSPGTRVCVGTPEEGVAVGA